ncbi:4-aminobutyrate aminotransferase [Gammaproteobacteria bacterium]|nr:4-aminobutyrate aminotransferase [Gammaproteobacteria bacterium]
MNNTNNAQLNQRRIDATPKGVGVMCPFFVKRAENATIWDIEDRQYIDFAAGIAVLNTGHCHPHISAAIAQQLKLFTHTAYQIVPYASYIELAERLNKLVPIAGIAKTAMFTTGAEAIENAIKIARSYTKRPGIIAFDGAFHGRTLLTLALTGKVGPYKLGFGPFPASIYHAQYPNELHGVSVEDALKSLQRLFKVDINPTDVAAIIIEPIQGEGGFNIAPAEFMQALRELCDQHGILLIADEIQTGFARTGKLFAMEHYSIKPDLITMAKSLAGGMPLSAVSGRVEVMDTPDAGGLGGTYAGNPLSIAAALAVLDVIEKESLCKRAEQLGLKLADFLTILQAKHKVIAEVRHLGSMVAVEFNHPDTGEPFPEMAKKIQEQALKQGLLLLSCGVYGNVIRFLYPLTILDAQFDQALKILEHSFDI